MDKPVIKYLGATPKDVKEAAKKVFGEDSFKGRGRKDKNRGTLKLKPRFEDSFIGIASAKSPQMTLEDPNLLKLKSYSRILMKRNYGPVTVYMHSGVLLKLLEPDVMEMDNGEGA